MAGHRISHNIAHPLLQGVIAVVLVILASISFEGSAHADKVGRLISKLTKSKDYKVRLSAALSLAKVNDQRTVPAFLVALRDSDKTVRSVAAASLGKAVTGQTPKKLQGKVLTALKQVAAKDGNSFVRKQAKKSYNILSSAGSSSEGGSGSAYIDIGGMDTQKVSGGSSVKRVMKSTITKTFAKRAKSMMTKWPSRKGPSKRDLRKKGLKAFHVNGTLTELSEKRQGSATIVSCKISMLLATYPEKSMFGFLKGGARVQAGTSATDIRYAKEDCVAAVVEDLVAKKIIPTIQARVP